MAFSAGRGGSVPPRRRRWYFRPGGWNTTTVGPAKWKVPASGAIPPMAAPWPPSHLVRELTTMSAPCPMERRRYGVVKVPSTISGR